MFSRVPSSSALPAVPSDPALNGSSGNSLSELSEVVVDGGGGDVIVCDVAEKFCVMPLPSSELGEWGEIIRTVLPVFVLGGRWTSAANQ